MDLLTGNINKEINTLPNNDDEFPKEMSPATLNFSILRSDANLPHPQATHTQLVPEYKHDHDTELFYFS